MSTATPRPHKPFLPIPDQITLLTRRGMTIDPTDDAERWLKAIGYYRLSGYIYPFRAPDPADPAVRLDSYVPGTTFQEVVGLYEFDRHLKTLMLSALERIEVALRSQVAYTLGRHGAMAYKAPGVFRPQFCQSGDHNEWLAKALQRVARAKKSDHFVKHHMDAYHGELPIWAITDVLDFSDVSKLFAGMTRADQQSIASWFSIPRPPRQRSRSSSNPGTPLTNFLLRLTIVRNICAHHSRLWNRKLAPTSVKVLSAAPEFQGLPSDQFEDMYGTICLTAFLLNTTSPGHTWTNKVGQLVQNSFANFTVRTEQEMGFPVGWQRLPLWLGRL
ncbi:Abi family protein [Nocardia gipuzkoensis]